MRVGSPPTLHCTCRHDDLLRQCHRDRFAPQALSLLRIVRAYLFLLHGSAKLLGLPKIETFANLQIASLPGIADVIVDAMRKR